MYHSNEGYLVLFAQQWQKNLATVNCLKRQKGLQQTLELNLVCSNE